MQTIANCIEKQLALNTSKNLFYPHIEETIEIAPPFESAVEELLLTPSGKRHISKHLVSAAAQAFINTLYGMNQYLRVGRGARESLEQIYGRTWRIIVDSGNIHHTLRTYHYPALTEWLLPLYPQNLYEDLRHSPYIGRVVCEEYSATFQLDLFDMTLSQLQFPLLDIGCGSSAGLVRYLQSQHILAYGIDRVLNTDEDYLREIDWFDWVFEPRKWGTIVSNMAFTNHLIYTYHYDEGELERYLLTMRDILQSLSIGGSFYYAPSVDFVEQYLDPTQYKVVRKHITGAIEVSKVTRMAR